MADYLLLGSLLSWATVNFFTLPRARVNVRVTLAPASAWHPTPVPSISSTMTALRRVNGHGNIHTRRLPAL